MERYKVHVTNDPIANSAYKQFCRALGLACWEPPSDIQRRAFDIVFSSEEYDMNEFLRLCAKGHSMADCVAGARIDGQ